MASGYCCCLVYGLEMGQPLFAAVLEPPMRDLLAMLQFLTSATNRDSLDDPFIILDAEEELHCFNAWFDSLPDYQRTGVVPSLEVGAGALAVSFLLGWWLGWN